MNQKQPKAPPWGTANGVNVGVKYSENLSLCTPTFRTPFGAADGFPSSENKDIISLLLSAYREF